VRTIQSKEDLVQWAKEVNNGLSIKQKPDYQDYYAHSTRADINKFFIEANGERALIVCSVHNCMAYEEVERLLTVLANHKARKVINEEIEYYANQGAARLNALNKDREIFEAEKRSFKESMKPYHKRLAALRKRNEFLEARHHDACNAVQEGESEISKLRRLLKVGEEKMRKFENARAALAALLTDKEASYEQRNR
jgi:hypothetical protein